MNWYFEVLKKYAVFSGRASRKECWIFVLVSMLIGMALVLIDGSTGLFYPDARIGLLSGLYTLAVIVPSMSVGARRLHDTNRSGWWMLILLVPLIGAIVLLVFLALDSDEGANQYGPYPKGI